MALLAADLEIQTDDYRDFAKNQIYYILGDCCIDESTGNSTYSYLIGFGHENSVDSPRSPHHRSASCNLDGISSCTNGPSYHVRIFVFIWYLI